MEMVDYVCITSDEKRRFLHSVVVESLMQRRIQLLRQLAVAYNSKHIRELEDITTFISNLARYIYTDEAFSSHTLDGITYRGLTLEQFCGKPLKQKHEVQHV